MREKKKLSHVEDKWTFKQVAYALLNGNAEYYALHPDIWVHDANKLAGKLRLASDLMEMENDREENA